MPEFIMDDEAELDCRATPSGIVRCLRMLAEEAAELNLAGTLLALTEALETCEREGGVSDTLATTLH